jgi:hypothetical protein
MIPISKIKIGDSFCNMTCPINNYVVIDIDKNERKLLLQTVSLSSFKEVGRPFWKSNKDCLINENNIMRRDI